MTRNFVTILDIHNNVHVVNAVDIIDIVKIKPDFDAYTICCVDSHKIDISSETYNILVPILKPIIIPDLIAKSKLKNSFPKELPESLQDQKL